MANVQIRLAKPEDAASVARIYEEYMTHTTAALEIEPPTSQDIEQKICTCLKFYPFLVCEVDGEIVAYAYAFRRFEEQSFDWSVFISTYVTQSVGSKGIGRAMLAALEDTLREMGVVNLYALAIRNQKSEYFHMARGFAEAGRLREATYKDGRWRDLVYYGKSLALHETAPAPIRSVQTIATEDLEQIFTRARRGIKL